MRYQVWGFNSSQNLFQLNFGSIAIACFSSRILEDVRPSHLAMVLLLPKIKCLPANSPEPRHSFAASLNVNEMASFGACGFAWVLTYFSEWPFRN